MEVRPSVDLMYDLPTVNFISKVSMKHLSGQQVFYDKHHFSPDNLLGLEDLCNDIGIQKARQMSTF